MYLKLRKIIPVGLVSIMFLFERVHAQTLQGVRDFKGFVSVVLGVLEKAAAFLVGLAVFIIIYGIFKYITRAADPEARKEGLRFVAYGVVGVFIMISMWGLVRVLVNTFYFSGSGLPISAPTNSSSQASGK